MAYATPAIMEQQFDVRILGDLVNDDGTRATASELLSNGNLAYALSRATGDINSACQIGQRYTPAELSALTGDDAALLQGITCDIAYTFLAQRRGMKPPMYEECLKRSEDMLTKMRDGSLIFNVPADVGAGIPTDQFPSQATYQTVNLLRDATNNKFFPLRRVQSPASGGYSGSN